MNLEEYIKSTKWIEDRQFFQTLSGFETVTNFSNLPFDLSPETNELFKHSFLCHYLRLGQRIDEYRRTIFRTWERKTTRFSSSASYDHYGFLGYKRRIQIYNDTDPIFIDLPNSCWFDVWKSIEGDSVDISFVKGICNKYGIKLLYPTCTSEQMSHDEKGNAIKVVNISIYALLIETSQEKLLRFQRLREKLFDYSIEFYEKMSKLDVVKEISDIVYGHPCYDGTYYDSQYNFRYTIFEDRIKIGSQGSCNWVFYENGLKDLPSAVMRIGLGFAIAEKIIRYEFCKKKINSEGDIRNSDVLRLEVISAIPPIIEFGIKKIDIPKPPEPIRDVSNLKDW